MKKLMVRWGITIDKPYWIFEHEDDFSFFYLEDGIEDPLVYYTKERSLGEDLGHIIVPLNVPFSEYIDGVINYSIKGRATGIF